jgi:hypothetical protein
VFLTWLDTDDGRTTVDCCANANVVALLAFIGLTEAPGYAAACRMIEDGIRWAGDDWKRARVLTPYYPHPGELRYAVEHAIQCGSRALAEAGFLLQRAEWAQIHPCPWSPICGSAYGGVFWTSPVLQAVRRFQRQWRSEKSR